MNISSLSVGCSSECTIVDRLKEQLTHNRAAPMFIIGDLVPDMQQAFGSFETTALSENDIL